ncbi:MAG: TetR/AcrR family transcriptional regulator [Armatimonadota bacterium]|nr:TetR/AcrR family transcriptional regulator [Armatimonadota bacterium]
MTTIERTPEKKGKLIEAAVRLVLKQGYSATTVDQICAEAGVTKGSFFHYFSSKDEICHAAMGVWSSYWRQILASAKFEELDDPLDRVYRLLDTMQAAYLNSPVGTGCMVGTVAQELSSPNEAFRKACKGHFDDWVEYAAKLLKDAKASHSPRIDFDSEEVAWWLQSFVQGTLLIARSKQEPEFIIANIKHCRAYVDYLFGRESTRADGVEKVK